MYGDSINHSKQDRPEPDEPLDYDSDAMPGICSNCQVFLKSCTRPGVLGCSDYIPKEGE